MFLADLVGVVGGTHDGEEVSVMDKFGKVCMISEVQTVGEYGENCSREKLP